jgi:hypothetical protein
MIVCTVSSKAIDACTKHVLYVVVKAKQKISDDVNAPNFTRVALKSLFCILRACFNHHLGHRIERVWSCEFFEILSEPGPSFFQFISRDLIEKKCVARALSTCLERALGRRMKKIRLTYFVLLRYFLLLLFLPFFLPSFTSVLMQWRYVHHLKGQ